MPENPYESPKEAPHLPLSARRPRAILWLLVPAMILGTLFTSCLGAVVVHDVVLTRAIDQLQRESDARGAGSPRKEHYDADDVGVEQMDLALLAGGATFAGVACALGVSGWLYFRKTVVS